MQQEITPFQRKISGQTHLSPLTIDIHVLLEAIWNDNLGLQQLAGVLNQYPVITARLLSLANSAWAASAIPITTTENACTRLGSSVVRSVCIATAVASSFNASGCPNFDVVRFWTNNILTSEGAYLLAGQLPKNKASEHDLSKTAQTAGILHSLGLLWLAENLAAETNSALALVKSDPSLSVNDALLQFTGTDYCQAGAWIAKQWKLPDLLVIAIQHHRHSTYRETAWELPLIISAALNMVTSVDPNYTDDYAANTSLINLGVADNQQQAIVKQLASKYDKTRELARQLFM